MAQAELSFDGVAYTLAVRCVGGDALEVVVERKEDAAVWNATFTAKCERRRGLLALLPPPPSGPLL